MRERYPVRVGCKRRAEARTRLDEQGSEPLFPLAIAHGSPERLLENPAGRTSLAVRDETRTRDEQVVEELVVDARCYEGLVECPHGALGVGGGAAFAYRLEEG